MHDLLSERLLLHQSDADQQNIADPIISQKLEQKWLGGSHRPSLLVHEVDYPLLNILSCELSCKFGVVMLFLHSIRSRDKTLGDAIV